LSVSLYGLSPVYAVTPPDGTTTKGYLYIYIHTVYKYPFGVCLTGRGVATKGYLYVYIRTVYKHPFGAYLTWVMAQVLYGRSLGGAVALATGEHHTVHAYA
jgi:hypothetical protein